MKPLQERAEPVYVVPGSDAEAIARRKFKNKTVKPVGNGLRPRTIEGLLNFMPYVFQPNQSRGLDATFHFTFTGAEEREATITIKNRTLDIKDGLVGKPDVHVTADAKTWLGFLAGKEPAAGIDQKKDSLEGQPRLLLAFGKCFPSAGPRHKQVEILPQPSMFKREPRAIRRTIRLPEKSGGWASSCSPRSGDVTHNVKTFRFSRRTADEIPFDYLPGQFLTLISRRVAFRPSAPTPSPPHPPGATGSKSRSNARTMAWFRAGCMTS